VELYRRYSAHNDVPAAARDDKFLGVYLAAMAAMAWLAVLTGSYVIYPWYRAVPPAGLHNLGAFPRSLLLSSPSTSGWHSLGMEWKEYIAWLAPISITMAAAVALQYGRNLKRQPQLRSAVLCFVWVSLLAAGVAAFFGATINKHAPVEGGNTIQLMHGE
jgi:hypothetical protein